MLFIKIPSFLPTIPYCPVSSPSTTWLSRLPSQRSFSLNPNLHTLPLFDPSLQPWRSTLPRIQVRSFFTFPILFAVTLWFRSFHSIIAFNSNFTEIDFLVWFLNPVVKNTLGIRFRRLIEYYCCWLVVVVQFCSFIVTMIYEYTISYLKRKSKSIIKPSLIREGLAIASFFFFCIFHIALFAAWTILLIYEKI